MSMQARRLRTEKEARAYLAAVAKCRAFTSGGRPPIPRCDSGAWGDPTIAQGTACPSCACPDRADCNPRCHYYAAAASEAYRSPRRGYLVQVREGVGGAEGEIVDGVDLSPSLAEAITDEEQAALEPLGD